MKKCTTALGAAIAASLGATAADAAVVNLTLRSDVSYSGNGSSAGNITSTTSTWDYDTSSSSLTQVGGVFNVRFTTAPTTTLFRHTATGMILGAPTALATDFACLEGNFGATVGASICGNYSFGANFANESTATWGPGTAAAKTIGGDDVNFGPIQAINAYNYFATLSWDGTTLVMTNRSCNLYAPGNANGCATNGGFNTGYAWTLSTPVPAAVWLFGSALGLLGVARRRAKA
jgi:hypothetical protein